MLGRIPDIGAVQSKPAIVFVATAPGGIFESWVGTDESCTRDSIGWGDGV